jgi:hypothetical protein
MIAVAGREDGRAARAAERAEEAAERVREAFSWPQLVPAAVEKDDRRDKLLAFISSLRQALDALDEDLMIEANALLRELLNVRPTDLALPQNRKEAASPDFIARQFDNWVAAHSRRIPDMHRFDGILGPLDLNEPNNCREILQALALSTAPDHPAISEWFSQVEMRSNSTPTAQLLRLLAVRMGNALVFSGEGAHTATKNVREQLSIQGQESDSGPSPAYRYFVEPLVCSGGQLDFLAHREVRARPRPDLDGDPEIRALAEKHGLVEEAEAEKTAARDQQSGAGR